MSVLVIRQSVFAKSKARPLFKQQVHQGVEKAGLRLRYQVLAAAILLAALSFKIFLKMETTTLGYQLAAQKRITQELDQKKRDLGLKLSLLLRRDHLQGAAEQELGMKKMDPRQAVILK